MAELLPHPLENKKAPAFTLPSSDGKKLRLSSLKGGRVVLYFYPKDNTPGCTLEAQEFRDLGKKFTSQNATIIGVSPDDIESHCRFIDKQKLNFLLVADEDHVLCEKYGIWVEKNMYGRKFWGVQRTTVLIDENGKIVKIWQKVKPKGHAEEVLKIIKSLDGK